MPRDARGGGVGTRTSPERELGGFAAPDRARKRGKRVQERLRPLARGTGHRAERAGSSGGRGRRRAGTQFVGDSEPRARARGARGSARDENEFEARALVASHVRSALGFRV